MRIQRSVKGLDGHPTLGTMTSRDGVFTCVTLERSANGDHPCVPAGTYQVHKAIHHPDGPHPYPCPELQDVPGRSHIQMHIANRVVELLGCIAPGENVSDDREAIERSGDAFQRMMDHIGDAFPFTLEILDPPATSEAS